MVLVSLSLQFLFGIFFAPEGVIKWTHVGPSTERFQHFRYLRWFQYLTGGGRSAGWPIATCLW